MTELEIGLFVMGLVVGAVVEEIWARHLTTKKSMVEFECGENET